MSESREIIEAPLSPAQLAARWQALCGDPAFEDVAGKGEPVADETSSSRHGAARAHNASARTTALSRTFTPCATSSGRVNSRGE